MKFGKLKAIKYSYSQGGHSYWECLCDCGNTTFVRVDILKGDRTKSCGKCPINVFEIKEDYIVGYTSSNKKFTFDKEDFDRVKLHTWREVYKRIFTTFNSKTVFLHKYILEYYDNEFDVDHIDGNPSNNRKSNLRLVTEQQNSFNQKIRNNNTSGVTGVWYEKTRDKWCAEIKINNVKTEFKRFNTKEEAIRSRVGMEFKYFGEEFRRGQLDETNEIVKSQVEIEKSKLRKVI